MPPRAIQDEVQCDGTIEMSDEADPPRRFLSSYGHRAYMKMNRRSCCGRDVTERLGKIATTLEQQFNLPGTNRAAVCGEMLSLDGWDIYEFAWRKGKFSCGGCPGECYGTVMVSDNCYNTAEVNYFLWGLGNRLCNAAGIVYTPWRGSPVWAASMDGTYRYTLIEALNLVSIYRLGTPFLVEEITSRVRPILGRLSWTKAGYSGRLSAGAVARPDCWSCRKKYTGRLQAYLGDKDDPARRIEVTDWGDEPVFDN